MYDVFYVDRKSRRRVVATGLSRDLAAGVAREEARRLGAGRMFLAGSEAAPPAHAVVIVRTDE